MSYSTYTRLPAVNTYEDALARTKVTPIKGSKPLSYPLSERKYHRSFGIRIVGDEASKPTRQSYKPAPTAKDGDVELLLYGFPVITLHKPEEGDDPMGATGARLTLMSNAYWSASDCRFILELLYGYITSTRTSKGRLILTLRSGGRIVVPKGESLTLDMHTSERTLTPVDPRAVEHTVLRLNRASANAVRASYGEFFRYLKGMVGVRKYQYQMNPQTFPYLSTMQAGLQERPLYLVKVSAEELTGVVPTEPYKPSVGLRSTVPLTNVRFANKYVSHGLLRKPPTRVMRHTYDEVTQKTTTFPDGRPYLEWLANAKEFLALCKTPADDPEQFEKFRQAFVWLAFYTQPSNARPDRDIVVDATVFSENFNEIIFKYHSEEVFECVLAKPGAVPTTKYDKWVTRDSE